MTSNIQYHALKALGLNFYTYEQSINHCFNVWYARLKILNFTSTFCYHSSPGTKIYLHCKCFAYGNYRFCLCSKSSLSLSVFFLKEYTADFILKKLEYL